MFSNIKILLYISNFLLRKYWVVHEVCFSEILLFLMYRECGLLLMCEWHAVRWVFPCNNFFLSSPFPPFREKKLFKMSSFCFSFYSLFISLVSHSSCLLCWIIKICQGSYGWFFFSCLLIHQRFFSCPFIFSFLSPPGCFLPTEARHDKTKNFAYFTIVLIFPCNSCLDFSIYNY